MSETVTNSTCVIVIKIKQLLSATRMKRVLFYMSAGLQGLPSDWGGHFRGKFMRKESA